ncbi:ATP-binding cassette sub- B member 6, mitochondrial [Dimargaris cristalligena]|nr:ATP-binding cassette sub- B member 6, mitochondrial [Dimargaris cristalligena]
MYIEAAAVFFAVYADPATPTDWHPWLRSATIQQVTIAFTAAVYHFLFSEANFQSIIKKTPSWFPHWLQLWVVAVVFHTWELGQLVLSSEYPNNSVPSADYFARYLTLGIVVTKLLLAVLSVAVPIFAMWYHAIGIFSQTESPQGPLEPQTVKNRTSSANNEYSDSVPHTYYSPWVVCTRTFGIIYDLVFPLDLSVALRLASSLVFELFTQWARAFEPGYYKDLLDALAIRELAFPAVIRYSVSSMVNELANMHFDAARGLDGFVDLVFVRLGPALFGMLVSVYQYRWIYNSYFMSLSLAMGIWELATTVVIIPVLYLNQFWLLNRCSDESHDSNMALILSDLVKQYAGEQFHIDRHLDLITKGRDGSKVNLSADNDITFKDVHRMIQKLLQFIGIIMCLRLLARGEMKSTDVLFFVTHFSGTYRPLTYLASLIRETIQVYTHCQALLRLIDSGNEVCDPDDAPANWDISEGTIEFKDVYFSYNSKHPVLNGVSFKVQGGTTTAIVGKTGGGKTTITQLIARFYDVNRGSVTIDGVDVRHVKQRDLRKSISIVPQKAEILPTTIRHNIQYGSASTGMSATPKDVHEAAHEATSALDMITERKVQGALKGDNQGKTCVVIAHRLSTIIHADQILVLQDGGIAERGTFAELTALPDGIFKEMWDSQMRISEGSGTSVAPKPTM